MKNTAKFIKSKIKVLSRSFTGGNITKYSGINVVSKYLKRKDIINMLNKQFPTMRHNATKFTKVQIIMSIVYAYF